MSDNADTRAAWAYHDGTKHSPESVRRSRHFLEWETMPRPFKVYVDLEPIPLPLDFEVSTLPALAAIAGSARTAPAVVDRASLARLLHFSAGILRRRAHAGGEIYFRAAACTGALYHIDLYVVTGALIDLEAGVYHFSPHDFSLRRLRAGDHRGVLARATGDNTRVAAAPATIVLTSTYWRNSWKYQARAYRHCFWDAGTILANMLAVANAAGIDSHVALGFADAEVNRLLDLDTDREVSLALVALGEGDASPADAPPVAPLKLQTLPPSPREVDYPEIRAMHAASSLETPEQASGWRARGSGTEAGGPPARPGSAPAGAEGPREAVEAVILRRGSMRRFGGRSISKEQLDSILRAAAGGLDTDFVAAGASLADMYVIVNAVDGLAPGTYSYDRGKAELVLLQPGTFRDQAGVLALGQDLAHDAALSIYWLADLRPILERLGNRGYRAAQLDAAIGGGRTYLASYALGLGATGLTFFDDRVTGFFSPHAAGKSVLFLMAVGRGRRA